MYKRLYKFIQKKKKWNKNIYVCNECHKIIFEKLIVILKSNLAISVCILLVFYEQTNFQLKHVGLFKYRKAK